MAAHCQNQPQQTLMILGKKKTKKEHKQMKMVPNLTVILAREAEE